MLTYKAAPADSSSPTCQVPLGDIQLSPFGLLDRHTQYQCLLIVFLQILVTVAVFPPFPSYELTTFPFFAPLRRRMLQLSGFCLRGVGDGTPGLYVLGSAQLRLLMIYWVTACFRRHFSLILTLHVCLPQPANHTASFFCGFCFS